MGAIRQFLHCLLFPTCRAVTAERYGRVVFRGCTCGRVFLGEHGPDSVKALLRSKGWL